METVKGAPGARTGWVPALRRAAAWITFLVVWSVLFVDAAWFIQRLDERTLHRCPIVLVALALLVSLGGCTYIADRVASWVAWGRCNKQEGG